MECAGQPVIDTDPPVTSAAARNGAALERSGSIAISLGARNARLDQPFADGGAFDADAAAAQSLDRHVDVRKARQVLAGVDEVQADVEAGAASRRPETNWLDAEASISMRPPRMRPWPRIVKGEPTCLRRRCRRRRRAAR